MGTARHSIGALGTTGGTARVLFVIRGYHFVRNEAGNCVAPSPINCFIPSPINCLAGTGLLKERKKERIKERKIERKKERKKNVHRPYINKHINN